MEIGSREWDFSNAILQMNGTDVGSFLSKDALTFGDQQEIKKVVRGARGDREFYNNQDVERTVDITFMPSSGKGFRLWSEAITSWRSNQKTLYYDFTVKLNNGFTLEFKQCIITKVPLAYLPDLKQEEKTVTITLDYLAVNVKGGEIDTHTQRIGTASNGTYALTSFLGGF